MYVLGIGISSLNMEYNCNICKVEDHNNMWFLFPKNIHNYNKLCRYSVYSIL